MDDSPDWDLLRDDPRAFFELEQGFDRKDLKRAYNRWLRRYKPERAPEEFQRLRAGYERLDEELRYGAPAPSGGVARPRPDAAAEEATAGPRDAAGPYELEGRDLRAVAAELAEDQGDPQRAWARRALVVEELEPDDPLAFLRVLIEGARVAGGGELLAGWLYAACRDPLDADTSRRAVALLAEITDWREAGRGYPPAWFDRTTEPLWCRLAEELPFEEFAALFAGTREAHADAAPWSLSVLTFAVLRRALFRADERWLAPRLRALEEHASGMPSWFVEDVDVFLWLDRYREVRGALLDGDPRRAALDTCAREILRGETAAADAACFRLFEDYRASRDGYFASFPVGEADERAFAPLLWYAGQLELRHMRAVEEDGAEVVAQRVGAFLAQENRIMERSLSMQLVGYAVILRYLAWLAIAVAVFAVPAAVGLPWPASIAYYVVVSTALFLKPVHAFLLRHVDQWFLWPQRRLVEKQYERRLRGAVDRFLATSQVDFGALIEHLERDGGRPDRDTVRDVLSAFVPRDGALAIGALAHQFGE